MKCAHKDCTTCPYPECISESDRTHNAISIPMRQYKTQKQREYRHKALMKEFPFIDWNSDKKAPCRCSYPQGAEKNMSPIL